MGHRYGSCPAGSKQSFTEREYDAAGHSGRPRLVFLAPDDFTVSASEIEDDELRDRQRQFRHRVLTERVSASFSDPQHLAAQVVTSIRNWEASTATNATSALVDEKPMSARSYSPPSFFTHDGSPNRYRASNFVKFVAAPATPIAIFLDAAKQRRFDKAVKETFLEIPSIERAVPRGKYYQVECSSSFRSSTHRVWYLTDSTNIGYSANLDTNDEIMVGDFALHYIFFLRLCESWFRSPQAVDLTFRLECPKARFAPFFPEPDGEGDRHDYDRVNIRFNHGNAYLPEYDEVTERLDSARRPEALAQLTLRQLQETAGAQASLNEWKEYFNSLYRQTGIVPWGKLR